ncbi:MAG TPA: hypothetical protein VMS76_17270 [Planctomycetota bacterium]|nr:hypothetical protein [Planctomycetota bacterium]
MTVPIHVAQDGESDPQVIRLGSGPGPDGLEDRPLRRGCIGLRHGVGNGCLAKEEGKDGDRVEP